MRTTYYNKAIVEPQQKKLQQSLLTERNTAKFDDTSANEFSIKDDANENNTTGMDSII